MPRFTKHLLPSGQRLSLSLKDEHQGCSQVSHQIVVRTKYGSAQHPGNSEQRLFNTSGNTMRKICPFPPSLSTDCLISTSVVKITFLLVFIGDLYFNKRQWGKGDAQSARQVTACKQEDLLSSEPKHPHKKCEQYTHICIECSSAHL